MLYLIGQALGILSTVCCLLLPFLQKKRQMLLMTAAINTFCGLNLVLIGRGSSVIFIYVVAVIQTFVALRHLQKDTDVSRTENIIFLMLYVICGSLDLRGTVDILPVVGAIFHMLATFQKDVQKTRFLLLFNSATFLAYYILVGSTSMFSCMCTITTTLVAMYRYQRFQNS